MFCVYMDACHGGTEGRVPRSMGRLVSHVPPARLSAQPSSPSTRTHSRPTLDGVGSRVCEVVSMYDVAGRGEKKTRQKHGWGAGLKRGSQALKRGGRYCASF